MNKEQVEAFLKRFKLVMNPADEPREDFANDYDVVVLFDGKKVCDTKWGGGSYWVQNQVSWKYVVHSIFQDAESYCRCSDDTKGDDVDALAEFLDEFGYSSSSSAGMLKIGIRAFKACKLMYDYLCGVVLNNCAWNDGQEDSGACKYFEDICEYFDCGDSDDAGEDLVEIDWDSYVEDYK